MEVAYAFVARAGEFVPDGTFSVIGGDFSVMHSRTFPLPLPTMTLIAKLLFTKDEWGKHHLKTELVGEDNVNLAPDLKRDIDVPAPQAPEKKIALSLAVTVNGIQFPHPGNYSLRLLLDGQEVRSIKLEVVQLQEEEAPVQTGRRAVG